MLNGLEEVILFASLAHGEQKMVDPDVPYIAHVFGVASNVLEAYYNGNENFDLDYALKVSLLHDVIEDTNVSYSDIETRFGRDIADGVLALTKNENLPKQVRMDDSIDRIKQCKKEVAIVKLADRTFNMRSRPNSWDEEHCLRYCLEAGKIFDELGYANDYLKQKLEIRLKEYKNK